MIIRNSLNQIRHFSQPARKLKTAQKMSAWSIHSYGDIEELQLGENRIPVISDPEEILVEVKAASVNPIDSFMLGGYGKTSFQVLRNFQLEFPLILGRDFSGTIINKGHGVNQFNIGDEVYGFVPIHKQGSFAEAVLASQCHILPKPTQLTHEQSAALVYATMTAWSGLFLAGNLLLKQKKGLRVLVLGGSGGVGTAAIQLLKSQGCFVFATCSKDAVALVTSLGPDMVFDRNDPDFIKNVQNESKYHIIFDAANMGIQNIPNSWQYESYITLNSPLLVNNDKYGLLGGLITSAGNLIESNITRMCSGKSVRWGYFVPSNSGFRFIHELICRGKIRPVIQEQFKFKDLPRAIETLRKGHSRGKIVVTHD
ncbi:reticulon-4-interacting protein 1 homolog, mitochondrial [Anthonomus grandis grandis]|uniref:reticulon-4-interacting protein 1 homolog, mitochondrial n=1 Tax=Anthonomus grandis grandis TaxID=2921223 RepID=UPI0021657316|nr:reticulon-4-interacting protein 1 homolog, mitochondrial [Anthonomus grandis grandis]